MWSLLSTWCIFTCLYTGLSRTILVPYPLLSCTNQQRHHQSLKGELEGKTRESEAFRKSLEEKDAELQRLARHVAAQEAKLQQMSTTSHELQLRQQIDILSDLAESRMQLVEAEDERHRAELKLKLSQQESSSFQTQLATLEPKTVKVHASMRQQISMICVNSIHT